MRGNGDEAGFELVQLFLFLERLLYFLLGRKQAFIGFLQLRNGLAQFPGTGYYPLLQLRIELLNPLRLLACSML